MSRTWSVTLDEKKAIGLVHEGKIYYFYFCSAGCKAAFEKAPSKYTGA